MIKPLPETRALACHNPATGDFIGSVPMASTADVMTARQELEKAAKLWRAKSLKQRIAILKQFQHVLIDSLHEITSVVNKDCGKSRQDALIEVFMVVDNLHTVLAKAPKWLKRERVPSGLQLTKRCYVEQRPIGTVAVISPWNYPFMLALQPMLMALLAGNTVMLKPSEVTAVTGQLIERLFKRVPDLAPYVRVLHGDGKVGAAVVASKPDLIYLTGSRATGQIIAREAAKNMIPYIFELGGKDPMIVLEDANLAAAAKWGVWASCFNAGQTCAGIERVYVVADVYDEFVRLAEKEARNFSVGYSDEIHSQYDMGPLSGERQAAIVDDHLEDALDKGAQVLCGGKRDELMMEPTVIVDVNHSMKMMNQETFGPIMPIMRVRDEDEAIKLANSSKFGLGASVWGGIGHATKVLDQIEAGTLIANDVIAHFASPLLPFGGVKESGNGRSHGKMDLLQFTNSHSYMLSLPPLPFDIAVRMRQPGHYRVGEALLKTVFGVTVQQKLEPVAMGIKSQKTQRAAKQALDKVGGPSGLAKGATASVALLGAGLLRRKKKRSA